MDTRKIQTICLIILTTIVLTTVMHYVQIVSIPLIISILLSMMLTPLVNRLIIIRVPRIIAVSIVMIALCLLLYYIGQLFYSSINAFSDKFGFYQKRLVSTMTIIWNRLNIPQEFFPQFGWTRNLIERLVQFSGSFVSFGTKLGLTMLFLFFMLNEIQLFRRKFKRAVHKNFHVKVESAVKDVTRQVGGYLILKAFFSAVTGLLVWLSLSMIGMDMAALWGLLAFLLNFIPNLGSTIILIATMTFGLAQFFPQWNRIIAVWIAMPLIQLIVGNILDPLVQGDQLDISPLIILISLVIWGWILGITGMFLAIPLTVTLKISLSHFEKFKPLSMMMGSGNARKPKWRRIGDRENRD